MKIRATLQNGPSPADFPVEMVERKGIGHPDTLCDGVAEAFSADLSRFYLQHFGTILHHNVDKGLLWGGAARPAFQGGEIIAPMEIFLAGRATTVFKGVKVPVEEIAVQSARNWFREHLRYVDVERHLRVHALVRPTSSDLAELFARSAQAPLANDTSFGVGFAPLDPLETVVLEVERHLNSPEAKALSPCIGEDVKVMGVRDGHAFSLTVACAFVGRHLTGHDEYDQAKAQVREMVFAAAGNIVPAQDIDVAVNAADSGTAGGIYLTVTGTSAEGGDDGQVGRGNRINGLITPYRPMSLEALAGKNPVSHVGKIYNVAASRIARALVEELAVVTEAACCLLSRIGTPIDDPQLVDIHVRLADPEALAAVQGRIDDIARAEIEAIPRLWREIVARAIPLS